MNNSLIASQFVDIAEEQDQSKVYVHKRVQELGEVIEALQAIKRSNHWKLLEDKVWNGVFTSLQKRIRSEKDMTEIHRLQGQIVWAEKYLNLDDLVAAFKRELQTLKIDTKDAKTSSE